jgi:CubicO group peptidase (beta-lactamase class C family)
MPETGFDVAALDALFAPFNRGDAPGMVVGIAQNGVSLYRRAFGLASIEHGVANSVRTRLRIGSTSKHITCLAALLLLEEGKLDLDASVRRYLPALPRRANGGAEPTLRQLMTHTGGMRDSLDVGFLASGMTVKPKGESMAVQLRQRGENFAPGDKTVYNNGGYHMLSHVIAQAAGMPFERFLAERIFTPLGMLDTMLAPSDLAILPGVATLHVPQPDGRWRRGIFPSEEVLGEGGIISTIDDMLRWLAHLRAPTLVGSAGSWAQMLEPARLNNGMLTSYALGLMVEQYRGVDVIHHGGTVIGGHCQMLTVPAHGLDVIIISNGVSASPFDLANAIIEIVLGEQTFTQAPAAPAMFADFAALAGGRYASPSRDLVVEFADAGGKLGLVLHNSPPLPMRLAPGGVQLDFNRSATGPYRVAIEPLADGSAAPCTLAFEDAGTLCHIERLAEPPALAMAGEAVLGRYHCADLNAPALLFMEDQRLLLRIAGEFGPNLLELTPFADDLFGFKFTGELAPLGGTVRVERTGAEVTGLTMNTLRTRHLYLQRTGH